MADDIESLLTAATQAARAGNKAEARRLLEQVLEKNDTNERAWFILASVVDTPRERRICLENVLEINPNNSQAKQALERLAPSPNSDRFVAQQPKPPTTSTSISNNPANRTSTSIGSARPPQGIPTQNKPPAGKPGVVPRRPPTRAEKRAWEADANSLERFTRRINPTVLTFSAVFVLLIIVGLVLITNPGLISQTETPTASITGTQRTKVPVVAQQGTAAPQVAVTFLASFEPTEVLLPTWTPSITFTPRPSATPTPTSPPLAGYTISYLGERDNSKLTRIYSSTATGTDEKQLVPGDTKMTDLAWSPNGRQLAFISTNGEQDQLLLANADGSNAKQIPNVPGKHLNRPSWSFDGQLLAFASDATGNNEIYSIKPDGTGLTQITNAKGVDNIDPSWSPDGKQIVYASDTTGKKAYEITILDLGTKQRTELTHTQGRNVRPSWSPDGTKIVFSSTRDVASRIYTMRADGQDQQSLTYDDNHAENTNPIWSPDGIYIFFTSTRETPGRFIFAMTQDGKNISRVSSTVGNSDVVSIRPAVSN